MSIRKYKLIPMLMAVFIVAFALAVALQQVLADILIKSNLDFNNIAKITNLAPPGASDTNSAATVGWIKQYVSDSVTEVGNTTGNLDIKSKGDVIIHIGP